MKCGIGKYAFQMARTLQQSGDIVNILTPYEGDGDFTANLKGSFNFLKIGKYGNFYDKIIIQYHQAFFYDNLSWRSALSVLATHIAFYINFLIYRNKIEVVVHEIPFNIASRLDHRVESFKWRLCPKLIFHTPKELANFEKCYFILTPNKYELQAPHEYYYKFKDINKNDARTELGLPLDVLLFLSIGFIQPHKGFDRAIRAFKKANNKKMRLYVVGSLRVEWEPYIAHLQDLKTLAEENSNIHVIEKYLSDEEFDTWITACDVLIVPYREIWSSAVVGRAKLFGKPVIASDIGGLKDQLDDIDILFNDDEELEFIFDCFKWLIDAKSA
jgi:glycosyltransferase involved in cell wall biosynthesis